MTMGMRIYGTRVASEWSDYNGHMADYAYGIVFSHAATAYMERIGIDTAYREATNATLYTLDSRIGYLKECHVNEALNVEVSILDADYKRMHVFMRLFNANGETLALCEQLLMHVSRANEVPRAVDLPQEALEFVLADMEYSKTMEKPEWIKGRVGLRRKQF